MEKLFQASFTHFKEIIMDKESINEVLRAVKFGFFALVTLVIVLAVAVVTLLILLFNKPDTTDKSYQAPSSSNTPYHKSYSNNYQPKSYSSNNSYSTGSSDSKPSTCYDGNFDNDGGQC